MGVKGGRGGLGGLGGWGACRMYAHGNQHKIDMTNAAEQCGCGYPEIYVRAINVLFPVTGIV